MMYILLVLISATFSPYFVYEIFSMMASLTTRLLLPAVMCKEEKLSKVTSTTSQTGNQVKDIDVGDNHGEFLKNYCSDSESQSFRLQVKSFCSGVFPSLSIIIP